MTQATAYTVPDGYTAFVQSIVFTNTTGSAITATVNVVPAGGSEQTSNQLYAAQSIPANQMVFDQSADASLRATKSSGRPRAPG